MRERRDLGWFACLLVVTLATTVGPAAVAQDVGEMGNAAAAQSVQSLQQRLLADPQTANAVQALRDDPDVQALLADPSIGAALARGDIAALLSDPKIRRLADNPAVQGLSRQVRP